MKKNIKGKESNRSILKPQLQMDFFQYLGKYLKNEAQGHHLSIVNSANGSAQPKIAIV